MSSAASAVTLARSSLTASISSTPVVASSTVASVSACDDHTGVINTHMEFLPPARATTSMLRSGPFTRAGHRQASAVDAEMKACAPWNAPKPSVEVLATTGQRRVIRRPKVESQQHEERREKARCLTEREMEEKTPRQGGLDREVRVRPLRASRARSVRFPGGDGRRGQPDGDVASTDQSAIRGGPVLDVVLCLVRGMDARLHPSSLVCPLAPSLRIRAPTPRHGPRGFEDMIPQVLARG